MPKEKTLKELREEYTKSSNEILTRFMNKAFPLMVKQVNEAEEVRESEN